MRSPETRVNQRGCHDRSAVVNEARKRCGFVRRSNWRVDFLQVACRRCVRSRTHSTAALPGLALLFRRGSWHKTLFLPAVCLIISVFYRYYRYLPDINQAFCLTGIEYTSNRQNFVIFFWACISNYVFNRTVVDTERGGAYKEAIPTFGRRLPGDAVLRQRSENHEPFSALRREFWAGVHLSSRRIRTVLPPKC